MTEKRNVKLPRVLKYAILTIMFFPVVAMTGQSDALAIKLRKDARRSFSEGRYKQTEDYLRQAATEAELAKISGPDLALILGDLANVLLTTRKYDEAEYLLNRAIVILKSGSSDDRRPLPILLGNLGKLYQQTGRLDRSEAVLRESLQLGKKFLVDEPLYLAELHNNLGVAHLDGRKLKQAERDFKTALTLIEETSTANQVRKAHIFGNLSALYFIEEKWSLAEDTLLRSVEIVERLQGPTHPNLCPLLDNLGYLYFKSGNFTRAEIVLRREMELRKTAFGTENASTALTTASLANVLSVQGKYDEAGRLFTEALNTQERMLGRSPEVATTLDQFANYLRRTNNSILAGDMASRAESIRLEAGYTVSVEELRRR